MSEGLGRPDSERLLVRLRRWAAVAAALAMAAGAATIVPAHASSQAAPSTCGRWMDRDQTPNARAGELLAAMTTTQKLSMVHQAVADFSYFGAAGEIPGIASLCIPSLVLNDAGSGLGDGQLGVTAYPAAIAQSASWDPAAQYAVGASLGREADAKGVNILLAPDVNIARVPLDGRTSEQFGEDPYLSGQTAAAYIQGVQSQHVIATVKHYDANNQETNRATIDEKISDRVLHEIYQPAFGAAVNQGHVGAVMCSYNQVNGAYACQNPALLRTDLDGQYGFQGFVMSDWGATHSTVDSAKAGLDMEMDLVQIPDVLQPVVAPSAEAEDYYGAPLTQAVGDGQVSMSVLDDMVSRILRSMFAVGLFDHPVAAEPGAYAVDADTAANQQVAQQAAEDGTVLLKDTGAVLPLGRNDHQIALIGTDAGPIGAPTVDQAGGSVHVQQEDVVTPLAAITSRAQADGDTVVYNDGSDITSAVAAAKGASVAIVYGGYSEAEGSDLPDLGFNQAIACTITCVDGGAPDTDQLIAAVAAVNPHTVVVLNTGGPVLMPWVKSVAGVVEAWYPGEQDGAAAAAVLFGDVDPGGKLPITFPASQSQLPTRTAAQYPGVNGVATYSEGLDVGYRWYTAKGITPLFPFGFGLSYTTFAVSGLQVAPAAGGGYTAQATVTNTGARAGSDVVQLYVEDPASTGEPPEQLKGYQKVELAAGHAATVTLQVPSQAFAIWTGGWTVPAGCYGLAVGDSSAHLPLRTTVPVGGATCS
jgi:beta-glucosidase